MKTTEFPSVASCRSKVFQKKMSEEVSEKKNQIVEFVPSESSIKRKDVFVGNLSLYTTGEKLRNFFTKYGEVENVRIMIHSETRRSRR